MLKSALEQMQKLQHLALLINAISEAGEYDLQRQDPECGCAEVRSITESSMLWLCSMALPAADELLMWCWSPSADTIMCTTCLWYCLA